MTFITIGIISLCLLENGLVSSSKFEYPPAHRNESVVDTYQSRTGDVKIKDPYRWLECPVRSDTLEFVKTQNKLFQEFVDSNPERSRIKEKVTLMNRYPKWDFPRKIGDWYYFTANDGSQEQSIYYKSKTWHRDNPEVVFDPNKLSKGDDVITIGVNSYNKDASILAYVALRNGLDSPKLIFPSLKSGSLEPLLNQKIMYHRLGTKQSEDILIAELPEEPEARIGSPMSYLNEGKTLVITKVGNGEAYAQNSLFTADIPSNITGKLKLEPFIPYMNAEFSIISVQNSSILVKTDRNAPNWKLVRIYLDNPEESNWETVIEEDPKMVLTWDKLIHAYLDDCLHWIRIRNLTDGEILVDRLPLERTNVNSFSSPEPDIFLFKVENATNPHTIYMLNFTKGLTNIELYSHFKLPNYEVDNTVWKEVFYTSYDGTKIHMFIVHKKNLKLDGSSFALVWGYGAFGTNIMPIYQPYRATLVENFNAVIALPNLRGGGEFGKKWNHLGQFANKQNSIDDFIAAAEYLIKHGYTSSQKVWAEGRSAGGLLIGAIINQTILHLACRQ
ncbi:Prolyl endopeptidase [Orchesella cincta]|uniref:Prolyl endopeptidase n=1 Tax=Orchesella cincta TaxID=48709 RepID=A0A1D2M7J9_ORCCI|nr:Prolyl endopeptidase [Orchesella cincta]